MGMLDLIMASEFGIQSGARPLDAELSKIIFGGEAPVPPPPPPPPLNITIIMPDDTDTYPLSLHDDVLKVAARNGETEYGYYCPSDDTFETVSGMTGSDIKRVEYISGNNNVYAATDYYLTGEDTLKIKYKLTDACNVGGSFAGRWSCSSRPFPTKALCVRSLTSIPNGK